MKLLEILARDMKEWPADVESLQQSSLGTVYDADSHWYRPHGRYETAYDQCSAVVKKRQWEAAKPPNTPQEQTRQEIIDLAEKKCGLYGDSFRQLATVLAAEGYRKFEIVEDDV